MKELQEPAVNMVNNQVMLIIGKNLVRGYVRDYVLLIA
jgi:hypothetical protein